MEYSKTCLGDFLETFSGDSTTEVQSTNQATYKS